MRRGRQAQECHPVPSRAMADEHSSVAEPATDPKTDGDAASPFLGPNAWLVEEMYEQYRSDPGSVSENWQRVLRGLPLEPSPTRDHAKLAAPAPAAPAPAPPPPPAVAAAPAPGRPAPGRRRARRGRRDRRRAGRQAHPRRRRRHRRQHGAQPRRPDGDQLPQRPGQAARGQPQGHQRLPGPLGRRQGQLHPPHRLRGGAGHRRRRAGHEQHLRRGRGRQATRRPPRPREHRPRGRHGEVRRHAARSSSPSSRDADTLDFAEFRAAYEDLIRKAKTNKLQVTDFQGATITLTNPGTIGTVQSVPRLMPGQGVIVGVGTIDYPAEWQGADERALGELGVSKVVTLTSHLRPPHHPGRRVGHVPEGRARAADGRARLLPRRVPRARRAVRRGQVAARRQPARPGGGPPPQADAGRHAHPRPPRPRPPHRRPRPAGLERAGDARTSSTRPPTG